MDILDDMGVSKLSAKVFLKVNYSFKGSNPAPARPRSEIHWEKYAVWLSVYLPF